MEKITFEFKIWLPVLILILLLTVSIIGEETFPPWVVNISDISAVLSAMFLYFKDHSTKFFLHWNKFKGFFKRDTVSWSGTYKFAFTKDEYNFEEDVNSLKEKILASRDEVEISEIVIGETAASFKLKYRGYNRNIKLYYAQLDESKYKLTFRYEVSLSYSDSAAEYNKFRQILALVNKNHNVIGINQSSSNDEKELYVVKIHFAKYNPFYGLTLKNISEEAENLEFSLKFRMKETDIEINKNTLKAVSEDPEQLHGVFTDYVTLSNIE